MKIRSVDTLLTRTVLVSLLGMVLTHILSLGSLEALFENGWLQHRHPAANREILISTGIMAIGVVLLAAFIARWLTGPIRQMAAAVHVMRPDAKVIALPDSGPREVRELREAFQGMQKRIKLLIDERTRALAAVSHDLRTPLTRLKLRLEDVDPTLAGPMVADIEELEHMIDATLSYLRGEKHDEEVRPIDLPALLETIAADAADRGMDVCVSGPRTLIVSGRRLGLKRAFSNLVQNALQYGTRARISITSAEGSVQVAIDDDGPGIPEDKLLLVLEPFVRLEDSRSRDTGGTGLGLTIAKTNIEADAGTLSLFNRPAGGLRAVVMLPLNKSHRKSPNFD